MKMRSGVAVLAAAAALTLSACASSSSGGGGGGDSKTVSVLAIVDTSGPGKTYGQQELIGLKSAVKYYNANGGMDGRKVTVKVVNDNGDPATATSLAVKELGTNPGKYTAVYPGSEGTTIAALIPIIARYKAYAIALDDGNAGCKSASKCPTEFSLVGAPDLAEIAAAKWMKSKGYTKVGILEEQVDFTQSETQPMITALKQNGIASTKVSFPSTAVNVTAEMSQLKSAGVQAVFAEVLGPPAGYALKARAQLGWNVPVAFDIAGSSLDISKLAPASQLTNAYQTAPYCADPDNNVPAFTKLRKNVTGTLDGSVPCNLSGNGWDSMVLLNNAITKAKSTETTALVKATESLSPTAQADPNYVVYPKHAYTSSIHENVAQTASTFSILPVGTISGTRLEPVK